VKEDYSIPKHPVPIRLALAWQEPRELSLYLGEHAEKHTGAEYPSDLLNAGDSFLPAIESDGSLLLFNRIAVMVLSVSAKYEERPAAARVEEEGDRTVADVELVLEDGKRVAGVVTYWRPRGQRRLQDYLNSADHFIPVRDGEIIHLVNRDRIVSVSTR
jgi:hypothetical protein